VLSPCSPRSLSSPLPCALLALWPKITIAVYVLSGGQRSASLYSSNFAEVVFPVLLSTILEYELKNVILTMIAMKTTNEWTAEARGVARVHGQVANVTELFYEVVYYDFNNHRLRFDVFADVIGIDRHVERTIIERMVKVRRRKKR
jgi:hypothetical protein